MEEIYQINKLRKNQADLRFVGSWPDISGTVPVYHAFTSDAFNRAVGYARFINASSGTVLYRGQTRKYTSLLPSGARTSTKAVDDTVLDSICSDKGLMCFFNLDRKEIAGWHQYQTLMIESAIQHYGGKTYCMDFVDNHWCALWFGLYEFKDNHYYKRAPGEQLYVFLYVADTNGPCVQGMYIGSNTYTVDLRKALPSTFQRPASQHGWIVRKKERKKEPLDDRVIGIIEVSVSDAEKWLGEGTLLSEENFFPNFTIDQGYKVLLSHQKRSGITSNKAKTLPINTICNYHYSKLFYSKGNIDTLTPLVSYPFLDGKSGHNLLSSIFSVLLEKGWQQETCFSDKQWDANNPCAGQSIVTALMIQSCLGGDIYSFNYSNRKHYYNLIDGNVVDMTYSELWDYNNKNYHLVKNGTPVTKRVNERMKTEYKSKVDRLISNCIH